MVYKANGRIDATNSGIGTARQGVGFDDTAERIFTRKIIVK